MHFGLSFECLVEAKRPFSHQPEKNKLWVASFTAQAIRNTLSCGLLFLYLLHVLLVLRSIDHVCKFKKTWTSHLTPPPPKKLNYITVQAPLRCQHLNHPTLSHCVSYFASTATAAMATAEVQLRGVSRRWMSVWKFFGLEFQTCMVGMAITSQEPKDIR